MSSNGNSRPSAGQTSTGRIYAGESAAERAIRRRETLLDAGLQLFGTTGYRTATVRAICREARLTDRYFYAAFQSTEDLLAAVYEREFERLQATLVIALASPAGRDDFREAIRLSLDEVFRMASDPRVARVCWLEVLGVSPRIDALYMENTRRYALLIVETARAHFPRQQLSAVEQRVLGIAMAGAISQTVVDWMLTGYREPRSEIVSTAARLFDALALILEERAR